MLQRIVDREQLENALRENSEYCILLFWGSFSDAAQRALAELEQFSKEYQEIPVCAVDVQGIKGIHREYDVESVPTVVVIKKGSEIERFLGVESASFYALHLGAMAPSHSRRRTTGRPPRVTVYTSPGCPPCALVKAYLREHGISFTSIDISRDEHAAREIVRRSGQQAVPQIDINGRVVVGFDQARLASLLGITK